MSFLRDERGLETAEYIFAGALVLLFLAAIMNTIFNNVQDRAVAANTEMLNKIPGAPVAP